MDRSEGVTATLAYIMKINRSNGSLLRSIGQVAGSDIGALASRKAPQRAPAMPIGLAASSAQALVKLLRPERPEIASSFGRVAVG
jgi:hypothetical protein